MLDSVAANARHEVALAWDFETERVNIDLQGWSFYQVPMTLLLDGVPGVPFVGATPYDQFVDMRTKIFA